MNNSQYYEGASESEIWFFIIMLAIALIAVIRLKFKKNKDDMSNMGNRKNVDMFVGGKKIDLDDDEKSAKHTSPSFNESFSKNLDEINIEKKNSAQTAREQMDRIKKAQKEQELLDSILKK